MIDANTLTRILDELDFVSNVLVLETLHSCKDGSLVSFLV